MKKVFLILFLFILFTPVCYGENDVIEYKNCKVTLPQGISKDEKVKGYGINLDILVEEGILVWGTNDESFMKSINPREKDRDEFGRWRYRGYDRNGGLYTDDEFINDADSGRKPWEKNVILKPWNRNLCPYNALARKNPKKAKELIENIFEIYEFPTGSRNTDYWLNALYIQSLPDVGVQGSTRMYHITY